MAARDGGVDDVGATARDLGQLLAVRGIDIGERRTGIDGSTVDDGQLADQRGRGHLCTSIARDLIRDGRTACGARGRFTSSL
jgi:hypothetical protein